MSLLELNEAHAYDDWHNSHFTMCLELDDYYRNQSKAYDEYALRHSGSGHYSEHESLPFIPVNVFKYVDTSLEGGRQRKILSSSSTSGQIPSKVSLDRDTSMLQMSTLSSIMSSVVGRDRVPYFYVDVSVEGGAARDKEMTARLAALRGFSVAASRSMYLFQRDSMGQIVTNPDAIQSLADYENTGVPYVLFGYTFEIYSHLIEKSEILTEIKGMSQATLIHIGGWKKLAAKKISDEHFNEELQSSYGIKKDNIVNMYGFTEQLGVVHASFGSGYKSVAPYTKVIVRSLEDLRPVPLGEEGFMQFITPIAKSYMGLSILTDDIGSVESEGIRNRLGGWQEIKIVGRAPRSEIRGCGDVYAS